MIFKADINFAEAQTAFKYNELVFVIDRADANFAHYGKIANQSAFMNMRNPRKDWYDILKNNKMFEPENFIVDFGGPGHQWSKLYHCSQICNVRLLGQRVLSEYEQMSKEQK